MTLRPLLWTALLLAPLHSFAAPPKPLFVDRSSVAVMDASTAQALWAAHVPAKVWKLYPAKKWGFLSQVEGGFTQDKTCAVTARAMLLPIAVGGKHLLFKPEKTATAFDAQPGATQEQCRELAKTKLTEAIEAVVSDLVKN
jgi:hypothetical protein